MNLGIGMTQSNKFRTGDALYSYAKPRAGLRFRGLENAKGKKKNNTGKEHNDMSGNFWKNPSE